MGRITSSGSAMNAWITPDPSDQATKVMMFLLYTYIKTSKLLSFSNKLNKSVKLKPCDAMLGHFSK